jgi:hypothetical protein
VSFAAITLCVASQLVIPKVSVHSFIDSVRKLLDTPLCVRACMCVCMKVSVNIVHSCWNLNLKTPVSNVILLIHTTPLPPCHVPYYFSFSSLT